MAKVLPLNSLPRSIVLSLRSQDWTSLYASKFPVLLKGLCLDWPAVSRWRLSSYLREKVGHHPVEVELGDSYTDRNIQKSLISMADLVDILENPDLAKKFPPIYLAQYNIRDMPELKSDYRIPDIVRTGKGSVYKINIWLGLENTFSPCHYDPYHNILCQITGKKTVILYNPDFSLNLYPYKNDIRLKNTSQITNVYGEVDLQRFPLFSQCYGLKATLEPGDAVYIPFKWWHYCKGNSLNCSINYWWL